MLLSLRALQEDASAAALAPALPDLETLMQASSRHVWCLVLRACPAAAAPLFMRGQRALVNKLSDTATVTAQLAALLQAWSPEMQAHIESSPLPDPQQVGARHQPGPALTSIARKRCAWFGRCLLG